MFVSWYSDRGRPVLPAAKRGASCPVDHPCRGAGPHGAVRAAAAARRKRALRTGHVPTQEVRAPAPAPRLALQPPAGGRRAGAVPAGAAQQPALRRGGRPPPGGGGWRGGACEGVAAVHAGNDGIGMQGIADLGQTAPSGGSHRVFWDRE
eukprot:1195222-Prorocentrum_minimum.AAC.3